MIPGRRPLLDLQESGPPQNPDFNLVLLGEPRRLFDAAAPVLLWKLNPRRFDRLHTPG
jgi:hypothetical protein